MSARHTTYSSHYALSIRPSTIPQVIQTLPHRIRTPRGDLIPRLGPPLNTPRRRRGARLDIVLCLRRRVNSRISKGVDVAPDSVAKA